QEGNVPVAEGRLVPMPTGQATPPFHLAHQPELPVAGRDPEAQPPGADVELGVGVVAVNDAVAVGFVHAVFRDVAEFFLVPRQEVRDVRLVLDQRDLRQIPDDGGGGGEFAGGRVG